MESLIHINQLSHSFKNNEPEILKGVNLEVNRGDVVVLLGDNGIGKTTLLKCISGFLSPTTGSILFRNKAIREWDRKELAKNLAYVSTQVNFSSLLKVWEFIAFGRYPFINWLGTLTSKDMAVVKQVMNECGIEHLYEKDMASISDGERQKVIIARSLAQESQLMILDEPTTHLDIKNSRSIFQLIQAQSQEGQKTILFSSHQVEQAIEIANKIWLFNEQQIIQTNPEEFKSSATLRGILYGE